MSARNPKPIHRSLAAQLDLADRLSHRKVPTGSAWDRYATQKAGWLSANKRAPPEAYRAAMREILDSLGLPHTVDVSDH